MLVRRWQFLYVQAMFGRLIRILALLSFAAHALLPAGFMVSVSPDTGAATITICTGAGMRTLVPDGDRQPATPKTKICEFATAAAASLMGEWQPSLPAATRYASVSYVLRGNAAPTASKPRTALARGPPSEVLSA